MSRPAPLQLSRADLDRLRKPVPFHNLTKIPLFVGLMAALTWMAWESESLWALIPLYIAIGYLWMGMVTFMHDALHYTLFQSRAANWAFGILCMLPIFATFVGFREDHIEHHRHNRSPRDPDAFTMGRRGFGDFVLFYAYALIGGVLSFIHFNFIYPFQKFGARLWAIQIFELALKAIDACSASASSAAPTTTSRCTTCPPPRRRSSISSRWVTSGFCTWPGRPTSRRPPSGWRRSSRCWVGSRGCTWARRR